MDGCRGATCSCYGKIIQGESVHVNIALTSFGYELKSGYIENNKSYLQNPGHDFIV